MCASCVWTSRAQGVHRSREADCSWWGIVCDVARVRGAAHASLSRHPSSRAHRSRGGSKCCSSRPVSRTTSTRTRFLIRWTTSPSPTPKLPTRVASLPSRAQCAARSRPHRPLGSRAPPSRRPPAAAVARPTPSHLSHHTAPLESSRDHGPSSQRALETILEPGDVLWLPRFWWHLVRQLDAGSPNLSLNFWVGYKGTSGFMQELRSKVTASRRRGSAAAVDRLCPWPDQLPPPLLRPRSALLTAHVPLCSPPTLMFLAPHKFPDQPHCPDPPPSEATNSLSHPLRVGCPGDALPGGGHRRG